MKSYTFKIVPKRSRGFYVIIEAFESNTFDQLHRAILGTLRWDEDHLYSFFMSGKAWDRETEYSTDDCVEDMPMPRDRTARRPRSIASRRRLGTGSFTRTITGTAMSSTLRFLTYAPSPERARIQ